MMGAATEHNVSNGRTIVGLTTDYDFEVHGVVHH